MNISRDFLKFVGVTEAESAYDKMVKSLDAIPASKAPRGLEELIDLIAQTLNGGLEQWVSNDYISEMPNALSFMKQLGPVSKEGAALLTKLSSKITDFADMMDSEYSEDEYEQAANELEAWDDWLYANDRDEKIAKEALDFLKAKDIYSEAALRRLASSSDKSKFASLKKQIDDLEKQKLAIRDELAKLVGTDQPEKSDALRDKRTQILDKIKKLEDEKRKMHNQFRGLSAK